MSDSKTPARRTPPPVTLRQNFPASPPALQDYQQPYLLIDGAQNIQPPAYSPTYSQLPSIDSFGVGPVVGPDGQERAGSSNDVFSSYDMSSSSSTLVEEREDAEPGLQPPPAYTEKYGELDINQDGMETRAQISHDGRVNININQKSKHLSALLAPAMRGQLQLAKEAVERGREAEMSGKPPVPGFDVPGFAKDVPPLNILIQIIGSRGDVQPFVALGRVLKGQYGHRVRVATHPTFKRFVEENGLEFFSLSGDPAELMAFMVKNPGLMPGLDSLKSGDVAKRRKGMWDVLLGGWKACIEPGDGTSYTPDFDVDGGLGSKPFIADAIIANPPSFGHIHCAEKLGVPLHLMFTMPWSPTTAFPHPLANIQSSNADRGVTNFLSYVLVDMMTWQGLGDLVNRFRSRTLGLDTVSTMWAPGMISRLAVPHTYCWSAALIPKPLDWPMQISISGFYFLSLAGSYTPPPDLARFLDSGPPPVYIGFGSIVVDDPDALTTLIFAAVRRLQIRALVSKGWGGLGGDQLDLPPGVMMLGNCPHDWLFPRCAAVVHHGGAGTTAAGIRCGKPTVVVPFFGDQPFWGSMVSKAGAGPEPVPFKKLTAEILAQSIDMALSPDTQGRAQELGAKISHENGVDVGAKTFLAGLAGEPGKGGIYRCMVDPKRLAIWRVGGTKSMLSGFAASVLVANEEIQGGWHGLKLCRHKEWETDAGPYEPISGGAGALLGTIGSVMMGVGDFPKEIFRGVKKATDRRAGESPPAAIPPRLIGGEGHRVSKSVEIPRQKIASGGASGSGGTTSGRRPVVRVRSHESVKSQTSVKSQGSGRFNLDNLNMYMGAGKGVSRIVGAGLKSPMDFTLSLAQGFHNAPKLYGDDVRPTQKITGFGSGLKAAGKGLSLGLYDGISGLVTQPIKGAKEEGPAGLLKGIGKGIGGIVLKGGAGVWGVPGYTMKGIHKEIQKRQGSDVDKHIINSRIAVSEAEFQKSTAQEQQAVLARWHQLRADIATKQTKMDIFGDDLLRLRSHSKSVVKDKEDHVGYVRTSETQIVAPIPRSAAFRHAPEALQQVASYDDEELENAIQQSVKVTSKGNLEQDRLIERAIRASVSELQYMARGHPTQDEGVEAYQQAINAPRAEDWRSGGRELGPPSQDEGVEAYRQAINAPRAEDWRLGGRELGSQAAGPSVWAGAASVPGAQELQPISGLGGEIGGSWLTDDPELEQALHKSLNEQRAHPGHVEDYELERALRESGRHRGDPRPDSEDKFERSLRESRTYQKTPEAKSGLYQEHDEELSKAIEESRRVDEEKKAKNWAEEQLVMEYVMKASLEEQGYQNRRNEW